MLEVIIIFALFATVFPIGKMSLLYVQPIFLTSIRMICAGIILLAYHRWSTTTRVRVTPHLVCKLFLLAVLNIYLTNVPEFWGLQYLTAAKACFIYNLSPFVSAIVSYFVFREIMTIRKLIGLLIGFGGFLPILLSESTTEIALGGIGFLSWAELALIVAATSTVIGWITMRSVVQEGVSVLYANGWSMLIGGLFALITSYQVEVWDPYPFTNLMVSLGYMTILMLISNIVCYNIYGHLLKRYTATFLTFAGFTSPLWAALYGWFFLSEPISGGFVFSCLAVFIGLYIFFSEEIRLGYVRHH